MPHPRRAITALALSTLLLLAAACSSGGNSSKGVSGGDVTTPTTAKATGPTTTIDPIVGNVDLGALAGCPFFTPADATAFLGRPVGPVNQKGSERTDKAILAVCSYNDQSGDPVAGVGVSAKLVPGTGPDTLDADLQDLEQNRLKNIPFVKIDGLGEAARGVHVGSFNQVITFSGEYELDVTVGTGKTMNDAVALAREVLAKLPGSH